MNMLFLSLLVIFLFLSTMVFGYFIVKKDKNKNFSFLTHFPFEIKSKSENLNVVFKGAVIIIACIVSFIGLYSLFIEGNYLIEKNLALIILFNAFIFISLFIIDTRKYKLHLFVSILFMVLNLVIYFFIFYLPIRDNFVNYHMATMIISVIILIGLTILTLLPSLRHWYVMEIDEEGNKTRGKIFPLAFTEWIHIIFYLLSLVILLINSLI